MLDENELVVSNMTTFPNIYMWPFSIARNDDEQSQPPK